MKGQNLLIKTYFYILTMVETVSIRKDAIMDLVRVKDEFDSIIESLELMADSEFMDSYKKSKEQIKKRDFADKEHYYALTIIEITYIKYKGETLNIQLFNTLIQINF